ncbi:TonB-dependent receptor [Novosphingobium sp. PASSN1]|uniref:TonB-dependent receptor n=1 Tax=Novosphingobium sp. PASSN1 TaxID=2015561 RepID=UPI000BC5D458|nr:TonB-dependent receptor [Novosphingobium sp. PASSN1]OYU37236.1 MAG: TonB-dependent receptor [Novosphingobium sp. PASSN1]
MAKHTLFAFGSSAIALTVAALAAPAFAQDAAPQAAAEAPAADDGAIVVTGYRASLNASASIKRGAPTIVEALSAEDIGKLPDVSIADSLARLPGVTSQRLEGRDQRLSIRGLGPDFGTTLLNGREQVTVGDNRGVEYDQYPAEFFKNVVVYKAPTPSLVAAGIAGTVDLRMLRPLSQKDRIVSLQLRGQMNGMKKLNPDASRYGYRASAAYVDKFADDTFGIAIGVSATDAPSQNERYNAWGFPNEGSAGGKLFLGGAKPYVQSNKLQRYGAVATLEYQPSDNFHSTLDVLYSHFKETQILRGIEFPIAPAWGSGATVQPGFKVENGLVTEATLTGIHAVQRNDRNKREADNFSVGWNNQIKLNDKLNLTLDASYSTAKRTDDLLETYSGTGYGTGGAADTIKISANPNGTFDIVPTLDYSNASQFGLTDPRGWGYNGTKAVVQAGFLNRPKFKDDLLSLRADLDGAIDGAGPLAGWQVGGNYSRRKKTSAFKSFFLCPKGAGSNCSVDSGTPKFVSIPDAAVVGSVPLAYLGVPKMLALDPVYLVNNSLASVFDNRPVSLVRDNTITEKVWTAYAMLKLDGDVGGKKLTGSIGVQAVHTDQSSNGSISNFDGATGNVLVVPATGGDKFWRVLPSANFALEVANATYVKLAGSLSMVRPRLDQERVNQELNFDFTNLEANDPTRPFFKSNGGNPLLRPYRAANIDVSVEHYFPKGGYVSLAGYYKKLTDFVNPSRNLPFDFAAVAASLPADIRSKLKTTMGVVSQPLNDGEGSLKGAEFTLSLPFSLLTPSLDGFGFYGSGSYTDSTIRLNSDPVNPITLPGLSDWVGNASVYYEKHGLQLRASYRYRSKFLAEVAGLSANPTYRTAKAEGILDAQIGYDFQPGSALEGLSILFQARNLTDRPFITYQNNDPRQVIDYQRYGRDFYIGLSYKF